MGWGDSARNCPPGRGCNPDSPPRRPPLPTARPAILFVQMETKALYGFLVAFAAAALLTPPVARFARRIGAVDALKARGLASEATPLLGGLAIFAGTLIAALLFMPDSERVRWILIAAAFITLVGAWDDWRDLPPAAKLAGQLIAALMLVNADV